MGRYAHTEHCVQLDCSALLALLEARQHTHWSVWIVMVTKSRSSAPYMYMLRVGQNHTLISIYGIYTVFLAGKSPYIQSYTVCIYGSGQPYVTCYKKKVRGGTVV